MHYSNKLDSYYTVSWPKQIPYSPAQSTAQDKAPLNLWTLIQQKQTGFQFFSLLLAEKSTNSLILKPQAANV